jgi:hypothetical protein
MTQMQAASPPRRQANAGKDGTELPVAALA